jgi:hypothetical protein
MKRRPSGWQLGMLNGGKEPPIIPARFDVLLKELGVSEKDAGKHPAVHMWVRQHHRNYFVPEKVIRDVGVYEDLQ